MKTIRLAVPDNTYVEEFVFGRSIELAKHLGRITGRIFKTKNEPLQKDENTLWFTIKTFSPQEAITSHITDNEIYGGIVNKVYNTKTIFHTTLPGTNNIPEDFSYEIHNLLKKSGLSLPGFSIFSHKDALKAFNILTAQGFTVRLKNPLESGLDGQSVAKKESDLERFLNIYSMNSLVNNGVVLEVNLQDTKALSVGVTIIEGEEYCYIGQQMFGKAEYRPGEAYIGSRIFLVKGNLTNLREIIRGYPALDEEFNGIMDHLEIIYKIMDLIPNCNITRINFDFLSGYSGGKKYTYITDQSFRPGGATAAEFTAIEELINNPGQKLAIATSRVRYSREKIDDNPKGNIYFNGFDKNHGFTTVWAYSETDSYIN